MRNKIKQLMNKEEGFTLVELLAVIVILGIIVAIAVPQIGNIVDRAEAGAKTAEHELVIDAARLYLVENDFPSDGKLTVSTLVTSGYLEETNSKNVDDDHYVLIVKKTPVAAIAGEEVNDNYTYEYKES